ncbi:MAG: metallophosphoesterase [Pseudomonadota bacterium]
MIRRFIVVACVVLVATVDAVAEEWRYENVARVVAISDVHGAYDAMTETLQHASILNDELHWSGGSAHLVIVGDILDRGPDSRAAMDLLMRLENEALAAGGRVQVLIGNHESMLLKGDMRYVSDAEYAAFAGEETADERAKWLELYAARHGVEAPAVAAAFDQKYPAGYFAMRRAFRPDGKYGRWLLDKNILAVIDRTAYVHGGLPPKVESIGADGVNRQLREILELYTSALAVLNDAGVILPTDSHYDYADLLDNYVPGLNTSADVLDAIAAARAVIDAELLSVDGPLWYRSNIVCQPLVEEYRLDSALQAIDADRLVVGHTPTASRQVQLRFDGRLVQIDTGMLNFYYRGQGHALVVEGDAISIVAQDGSHDIEPAIQARRVGRRASDLSADRLQAFLENATVRAVATIEPADSQSFEQTIVTLDDDVNTVRALFHRSPKKGVYPGVAAYRLDRLLELNMVPVTVMREIDGKPGSLQFLPDNVVDETARSAAGEGGSGWCSLREQWPTMSVFDTLIYNEGRLRQRMLYDKSSWKLILSEHDRAFSTKKGRPPHLKNADLKVHPGWKKALNELTDEVIDAEFGDVLDKRRLKALKARRDELLVTGT